jgi:hydroxymethylbilane synthase
MIVGTRGSELALAQAREVVGLLRSLYPDLEVEERVVRTAGDAEARKAIAEFSQKGIFVREIDELVVQGKVDLAVHSLKDVPTELVEGLEVAAVLERRGGTDVLVSRGPLEELPMGATIGTSSTRRKAQLRRFRRDLSPMDIRGNVTTRIAKWRDGEFDALVLSITGLERLNVDAPHHPLDPQFFVPAPGQGVIAVTSRREGEAARLARALDHGPTRTAVEVERAVLRHLGGGCLVPIACRAMALDSGVDVHLQILSPDGSRCLEVRRGLPLEGALEAARSVAEEALRMGGGEILGGG